MKTGIVYFVGAGPGDPDLITVKGMNLLKQADVIIYDRLANPQLLEYAKANAEHIFCGKEPGGHSLPQEAINQLIVKHAKRGKSVVRLKGGDPCMFGRVGEEAEHCQDNGIPFEMIPGITSGIAAPAYAGIPLTHRNYSASVLFLTGHRSDVTKFAKTNWAIAAKIETLVIYMGIKNLPEIRQQLLRHGKSPATPIAVIEQGTTINQKTVISTLEKVEEQVSKEKISAPAIIVLGEVVKQRSRLNWFEDKQRLNGALELVISNVQD